MTKYAQFQRDLHNAVTTAMIQVIEQHIETPSLDEEIVQYLVDSAEGAEIGFSFRPDNNTLIEILHGMRW